MKIGKVISHIASEAEDMTTEDDNWLAIVLLAAAIAAGIVEVVEDPVKSTVNIVKNLFL